MKIYLTDLVAGIEKDLLSDKEYSVSFLWIRENTITDS